MHPFTQKTIKSVAMSVAISSLSAVSPATISAQEATVNKLTIVTKYQVATPAGQITINQEAKRFFAWLAKQSDAVGFLMSLGFSKAESSAINQMANASADGKLTKFLSTKVSQELQNNFYFAPWLVGMIVDAHSNQFEETPARDGTQSGAPNPCGKPPGLIDKQASDEQLATAKAAAEKYRAGLSNNSDRDTAMFVGGVVGSVAGSTVGGLLGSAVTPEAPPVGIVILGLYLGAKGRDFGATAGAAAYEAFQDEAANVADQAERDAAALQSTADRAQANATKSQKEADAAQTEADEAQQEADAYATAAANAQKKADETGSSNDQKTANDVAKTAAEKQAYADKKKQDAKDAAAKAAAAKEAAENAKKLAEESKKNSKKTNTTMPSGYGQGEVEDTPWGRYVQTRMLQYHLRILEMIAKGEDPTTILLNPYADATSSSPSKTPTTMITERLKLPLDPNTVLVGANTPCFDTKFEMAPEDGLSPTVINPAIYDEPKGGGVPGVPGSPLKTKP